MFVQSVGRQVLGKVHEPWFVSLARVMASAHVASARMHPTGCVGKAQDPWLLVGLADSRRQLVSSGQSLTESESQVSGPVGTTQSGRSTVPPTALHPGGTQALGTLQTFPAGSVARVESKVQLRLNNAHATSCAGNMHDRRSSIGRAWITWQCGTALHCAIERGSQSEHAGSAVLPLDGEKNSSEGRHPPRTTNSWLNPSSARNVGPLHARGAQPPATGGNRHDSSATTASTSMGRQLGSAAHADTSSKAQLVSAESPSPAPSAQRMKSSSPAPSVPAAPSVLGVSFEPEQPAPTTMASSPAHDHRAVHRIADVTRSSWYASPAGRPPQTQGVRQNVAAALRAARVWCGSHPVAAELTEETGNDLVGRDGSP